MIKHCFVNAILADNNTSYYIKKEQGILKVAIIGGGLAGIICATQLERLGITPDIFERNRDLAESYRHVGAALQIALRPIKDPLQYLNDKYERKMCRRFGKF